MRFDSKAGTYDLHAEPQRAFAAQAAEVILEGAQAGMSVVELGAGTGALTRHLCTAGLRVVATDASPTMVTIGRSSEPRADWRVWDAFAELPPPAVLQVSSGLLQWAPDPLSVLQSWGRSISPGGRMVHAFPCRPCLQEWYSLVPRGPLRWHDREEWVSLFQQAGLSILRERVWTRVVRFPTALHFVRSLHHSGVTGPRLLTAGELRRAIRQYDAQFAQAAGVAATWVWQLIEAKPAGST
jgi:SAM-dependent methyltransferase